MTFLEMTIKKIQIDHWRRQRVINCTPTTNYNPRNVYEPYTFYTETSQGLNFKNKVTRNEVSYFFAGHKVLKSLHML